MLDTITRNADRFFQPGVTYAARSICDHDCIFRVPVVRRTDVSVWIDDEGRIVRRAVQIDADGCEFFYPFGRYSMAPTIRADSRAPTDENDITGADGLVA